MPSNGFRSIASSGKGLSIHSNVFSVSRKTSQLRRRKRNGNTAIAAGNLAPGETHVRGVPREGVSRLDRRQAVRTVVPPHERLHHDRIDDGPEGRREI